MHDKHKLHKLYNINIPSPTKAMADGEDGCWKPTSYIRAAGLPGRKMIILLLIIIIITSIIVLIITICSI